MVLIANLTYVTCSNAAKLLVQRSFRLSHHPRLIYNQAMMKPSPASQDLQQKFSEHFSTVVSELSTPPKDQRYRGIEWSFKRVEEILKYNVPYGKRTRGLTVVSSYLLIKNGTVSEQEENMILSLGWAVEILQASFLVADDIMDQSETRRGQLCWYKKPGVGLSAVNDSLILESCVFSLLKKHCRGAPFYVDLMELFHSVIVNTEMGQSLDMLTSEQPTVDFNLFTMDRYESIVAYKTAFYSFYLPVAIAMYSAGLSDGDLHDRARDVLMKIGCLFQVQDDYLDCYGNPDITGKVGTDIEDNKCSWLIVKAIKIATEDQLNSLSQNYGKKDASSVAIVKSIYAELGIAELFHKYECDTYSEICQDIKDLGDSVLPSAIFTFLLDKIYKRQK